MNSLKLEIEPIIANLEDSRQRILKLAESAPGLGVHAWSYTKQLESMIRAFERLSVTEGKTTCTVIHCSVTPDNFD